MKITKLQKITPMVTITTWQSVYENDAKYFRRYQCIIGDEAHEFKAKSTTSILEKLTMCPYRIGTTGTLDDSKINTLVLEGLFGPVYNVISVDELIKQGSLSQLEIYSLLLKYPESSRKLLKKAEYQAELDYLVTNHRRNEIIANLAVKCKGTTLVLFQFVQKHGIPLHQLIQSKVGPDRNVYIIHGGIDPTERERIRQALKTDKDAIVVASYQTYQRGINAPSIQNIIIASPTKGKIRLLQSIGRGLRLSVGKTVCKLFDIGDDLSSSNYKNHSLRHFIERVKIYISQKFNYKTITMEIKDE